MTRVPVLLGDLIVAAFDQAATHTDDPAEVSRLAKALILDIIERANRQRSTTLTN